MSELATLAERLAASEEQARLSAREKETLLAELSHRVRNDLTALLGMIRIRAKRDPTCHAPLSQAADQIAVLARLNARLSSRGVEVMVATKPFLDDLMGDLSAIHGATRPIHLVSEAEDHVISTAVAAPLGLIANELVTNSLKHAFPLDGRGSIKVTFRRLESQFELVVEDNGCGPTAAPKTEGGGLGTMLIQRLSAQLQGSFSRRTLTPCGMECRVVFPS